MSNNSGRFTRKDLRSRREELSEVVMTSGDHHIAPITAHGVQESSLTRKLQNVLWATFLENGDWGAVRGFCRTVISWTTDMGTERLIGEAPNVDPEIMFPFLADISRGHFPIGIASLIHGDCLLMADVWDILY